MSHEHQATDLGNLGRPIGGGESATHIGNATQPHPTTGEHGQGVGVSGGVGLAILMSQHTLISSTLTLLLPTLNLAVNSLAVTLHSTPV